MNYHERYKGMDDKSIRNRPKNDAEAQLQALLVAQAAKEYMDKYDGEPAFRGLLATEIASQVVARAAREVTYAE